MTDQDYAKQVARIRALSSKWLKPLGLLWWTVHLEYAREGFDTSEHPHGCLAYTKVSWEYLEATITFNMPLVLNQTDDDLEYCFVHECCHILINEMRDALDGDNLFLKHEERVCTTLARAFLWTFVAGKDYFLRGE